MKKSSPLKTPLKGKYLVKNPLLYTFLKTVDFFSFIYFGSLHFLKYHFLKLRNSLKNEKIYLESFLKNPKKILLSNIAHLGDVLVSLKAAQLLKEKYPDAKIGFICSKTSKEIIEKFSLIDKIFVVDHWKINRELKFSKFKKFRKYVASRKIAINEIKKEKYEGAIDLHYHFPNSIYLLYKAKIPVRIGYVSAGFENFLTHSLFWENKNQHVSLYHLALLKFLDVDQNLIKISKDIFREEFVNKYQNQNQNLNLPDDYTIIHIGAGSVKKMWDINKWKKLTNELLKKGTKIVFTGKGKNEHDLINQIINYQGFLDYEKQLFNLCDQLDFIKLSDIVKRAKIVICVDSFILHLATALDIPTIVIYSGINNFYHWTEKKQNVIPIVEKLSCNPCYMKNGCKSMDCLNKIKIDNILAKIKRFECKS